jgi:hypothetical protein
MLDAEKPANSIWIIAAGQRWVPRPSPLLKAVPFHARICLKLEASLARSCRNFPPRTTWLLEMIEG